MAPGLPPAVLMKTTLQPGSGWGPNEARRTAYLQRPSCSDRCRPPQHEPPVAMATTAYICTALIVDKELLLPRWHVSLPTTPGRGSRGGGRGGRELPTTPQQGGSGAQTLPSVGARGPRQGPSPWTRWGTGLCVPVPTACLALAIVGTQMRLRGSLLALLTPRNIGPTVPWE